MLSDDKFRAFLLGSADRETEAEIEVGILDGSVDTEHLQQVEEELIDDHLFGRLSPEEERFFRSEFVSSRERAGKVEFARALLQHAVQWAPESRRRAAVGRLPRWMAMPWSLPLAGTLVCALLAALWLGVYDLRLSRELAQAAQANDEHERVIASMTEEQKRRTSSSKGSNEPAGSGPTAIPGSERAAVQPIFRLSPGASRGLAAVPVLNLSRQESAVCIVLELPFDPIGTLREELLSSEDKTIWSQQFSSANGISNHGSTNIVLPAALFATGEYRLRAEASSPGEKPGNVATYLFRVRRD
jgi:hypothetical protein